MRRKHTPRFVITVLVQSSYTGAVCITVYVNIDGLVVITWSSTNHPPWINSCDKICTHEL